MNKKLIVEELRKVYSLTDRLCGTRILNEFTDIGDTPSYDDEDYSNDPEEWRDGQSFKNYGDYRVSPLITFHEAQQFRKYVHWGICFDETMFDNYNNIGNMYVCLKNGFDEMDKDDPDYGVSMIAFICHDDDGPYGGKLYAINRNDERMTEDELANLGINVQEICNSNGSSGGMFHF